MERFKSKILRFRNDDGGAVAIEYAFIAAAIGVALIPALKFIVEPLGGRFDVVTNAFDTLWK